MKPTIRIQPDNLDLARRAAGLTSNADLARAMNVHPTTVSRTLRGDAQLGADFIAALLKAFPGVTFDQLFTIVDATAAVPA